MRLFHYHLVTSRVREVEERYVGKLGFALVARHGRVGDEPVSFEAGAAGWEELDRLGFALSLLDLQRGAVRVAVQPGPWELPRVDHLGVALDEGAFREVLGRAALLGRPVQEAMGRRAYVTTDEGYRLEIHPPRDWLEELFDEGDDLSLAGLRLRTDLPERKARALGELLGLEPEGGTVGIGEARVEFAPGGPEGRPELESEAFA